MGQRTLYRLAVYLILTRQDHILLLRRFNTGFEDGKYSFIAGHVEAGETATQAILREAQEEAGIILEASDLHFVQVQQRYAHDVEPYIDLYFQASTWRGEPIIAEADKCDDLRWVKVDQLPENLIAYLRAVVEAVFVNKGIFSEYGWQSQLNHAL